MMQSAGSAHKSLTRRSCGPHRPCWYDWDRSLPYAPGNLAASAPQNSPASFQGRGRIGSGLLPSVTLMSCLKEADRYPWKDSNDYQACHHRQHIAPNWSNALGRVDAANGACGIIADAKRRREQPDTHRQNNDHGIVDLVHANGAEIGRASCGKEC